MEALAVITDGEDLEDAGLKLDRWCKPCGRLWSAPVNLRRCKIVRKRGKAEQLR